MDAPPVEPIAVPVPAVATRAVKVVRADVPAADEPVLHDLPSNQLRSATSKRSTYARAADHDAGDRAEEYGIRGEVGGEVVARFEEVPRQDRKADNGGDVPTAADGLGNEDISAM